MAADPRRRQKKLQRRTAKRQEKKHQLVREQSAGLVGRLTAATKYPVLHSWVTEDLFSSKGMGQVLVSRALPNGFVAVAAFLVDRLCLGIKNALVDIIPHSNYDSKFVRDMQSRFEVRSVTPALARKLVEAAVAYARDLGFSPHPDYHKAKLLFGTIDASECKEEFEFGKDGKPMFISGPHDSRQFCQFILNILTKRCGPDGFNYVLPLGGEDMVVPSLRHGQGADLAKNLLENKDDHDNEA